MITVGEMCVGMLAGSTCVAIGMITAAVVARILRRKP